MFWLGATSPTLHEPPKLTVPTAPVPATPVIGNSVFGGGATTTLPASPRASIPAKTIAIPGGIVPTEAGASMPDGVIAITGERVSTAPVPATPERARATPRARAPTEAVPPALVLVRATVLSGVARNDATTVTQSAAVASVQVSDLLFASGTRKY
jgi:hypothetical protein